MVEYIERQTLLKTIKTPELQRFFGNAIPSHAVNWAILVANKAPAADVEVVRHGRWITKGRWLHCSECSATGSPRWKRCPKCEAKMDLEESYG